MCTPISFSAPRKNHAYNIQRSTISPTERADYRPSCPSSYGPSGNGRFNSAPKTSSCALLTTHPAFNLRSARATARYHLVMDTVPTGRYARVAHRPVDFCWYAVCCVSWDARFPHCSVDFGDHRRGGWFVIVLPLLWLAWPRGKEAGVYCAEA